MSVNRHTDKLSEEQTKLHKALADKNAKAASSHPNNHHADIVPAKSNAEHKIIAKEKTGNKNEAEAMKTQNVHTDELASEVQAAAVEAGKVQQGAGLTENYKTGQDRSTSGKANIRPPTRAQDTYSLLQAPAGYMSNLPRQRFQYIATFRFASDDTFESIFGNRIDEQVKTNSDPDTVMWDYPPDTSSDSYKRGQKIIRQNVINSLRKDLIWNVKSIDGPKVNIRTDMINQYNRKRAVYRSVEYDPVNVRFHDTMNNTAQKLWQYLYEHHVLDGRNKSTKFPGNAPVDSSGNAKISNMAPYGSSMLTSAQDFVSGHNFGVTNSDSLDDYPIKSLDLFLIHNQKYNLIRFVHPKITAIDHDTFTYDASAPVEIGMQFAYETVLYETFNHPFDSNEYDHNADLEEIFRTTYMPDTPTSYDASLAGGGSLKDDSYVTKMTGDMNLEASVSGKTVGPPITTIKGNNTGVINKNKGSIFGSILNGTPVSDAIDAISKGVYKTTKSVVEGFGAGLSTMGNSNKSSQKQEWITKDSTKFKSKIQTDIANAKVGMKNDAKQMERDLAQMQKNQTA